MWAIDTRSMRAEKPLSVLANQDSWTKAGSRHKIRETQKSETTSMNARARVSSVAMPIGPFTPVATAVATRAASPAVPCSDRGPEAGIDADDDLADPSAGSEAEIEGHTMNAARQPGDGGRIRSSWESC